MESEESLNQLQTLRSEGKVDEARALELELFQLKREVFE